MKLVIVVAMIALLLGFTPLVLTQTPEKAPVALEKLVKERLQAARQAYEAVSKQGDEEKTYVWSRRWMEAERDIAKNKAERVAALQAHFERMKKLEVLVLLMETRNAAPRPERLAPAQFYRAEADIWLAAEKAK
jgi:hypothetical protein